MSITRTFNGATILKPGAYSKVVVENLTGFPLQATGTVAIIGEAKGGKPGVLDILSKDGIQAAKARYKSGPIADALELLVNPSKDPRIANGASKVVVYKTNKSTQAGASLGKLKLTSRNYGADENTLSASVSQGSDEDANATLTGTLNGPFEIPNSAKLILVINGDNFTFDLSGSNGQTTAQAVDHLNDGSFWTGGKSPVKAVAVGQKIKIEIDPTNLPDAVGEEGVMVVNPESTLDTVFGLSGFARGSKGSRIITFKKGLLTEQLLQAGGIDQLQLRYVGAGSDCHLSILKDAGVLKLKTECDGQVSGGTPMSYRVALTPDAQANLAMGQNFQIEVSGHQVNYQAMEPVSIEDVINGLISGINALGLPLTASNVGATQLKVQGNDATVEVTGAVSDNLQISDTQLAIPGQTLPALADNLDIALENAAGVASLTISQLVDLLNGTGKYQASAIGPNAALGSNILDFYANYPIKSAPGLLRADDFLLAGVINDTSALATAERLPNLLGAVAVTPAPIFFSGGSDGVSTNSDFADGFDAFKEERINVVVPLVSSDLGNVSVDSVNALAAAHVNFMWSTTGRSERSAFVSKAGSKAEIKQAARNINSAFVSLVAEHTTVLDRLGNLVDLEPWSFACICAGLRAGAEVGEPLTSKFINVNNLFVKQGDWNPRRDYNEMIDAGVLIGEAVDAGGYKITLGNTTYGVDPSFVWNRESVVQAAGYICYDLRFNLDLTFTGTKARSGSATAIANFIKARMTQYLRADIIVGDDDNGKLGYKNLSVLIEGNAASINVSITPVQGIDFILPTIYLADIRQSA